MATPKYKIYSADNEFVASVRYLEDAACLVGALYHGGTVRFDHGKWATVWTEGAEEFSAADSYDSAARLMLEREAAIQNARYKAFCARQKMPYKPLVIEIGDPADRSFELSQGPK